jgi:putative ubiquitin-RnfH superfamily antitoxin RatB of RatAB toxin-antitoxin module
MFEKKQTTFIGPDLTKLQEVKIDEKTRIYIPIGADPKEARSRYFSRHADKKP